MIPQKESPGEKWSLNQGGAVGLLVAAMALNNLQVGAGFEILEQNQPALKALEVPWQMLKPLLNEKFVRARQRLAETTRTALKGVFEIDHYILRKTLRPFTNDDEAILKNVVTLAIADDQKKFELSYASSEACTLCGAPNGGIEHLVAFCSKLCHVRTRCPFAKLLPFLPAPVLRGIPPAMSIDAVGPFWKE